MRYYLLEGEESKGPYESAELLAHPGFNGEAFVCPEDGDSWVAANDVPELASAISTLEVSAAFGGEPAAEAPAGLDGAAAPELDGAVAGEAAPEEPAPEEAAPAAGAPTSPSEKLVMIVDDDETFRLLLESAVRKEGFRVVVAFDGADAIGKLEPFTPDLIVTDLRMPRQGGYELMRHLQAAGQGSIPVVVVTGFPIDDTTIEDMRVNFHVVNFFKKPLTMASFTGELHDILGTQRLSPRQKAEKEKDAWS